MPDPIYMDLPTYLEIENESNYHEYLNQALRDGLSEKGWTIPQITRAGLLTETVQNPADGSTTTLKDLMPDGTLWFVIDNVPPVYVGKINGALVRFTTTPFV